MIKRYHEAPISIFSEMQNITDGDYALVHLFEDNKSYFNMFKTAVEDGRDVILDNSLFELGVAFDPDRYVYWINKLKPTWIIVPDSWKNSRETIKMFFDFMHKYGYLWDSFKIIGVAQGNSLEDVVKSYMALEPYCDKIAFNLDFSSYYYKKLQHIPNKEFDSESTLYERMSFGRCLMLLDLASEGIINTEKPHHLLGCGVPMEAVFYKNMPWVDSIDTSNPVMYGMHRVKYEYGDSRIKNKIPDKMCDHMNDTITQVQWEYIQHNVEMMKGWCS